MPATPYPRLSQKLLESLSDKIQITAYIKKDPALRSQISQLVDRYSGINTI